MDYVRQVDFSAFPVAERHVQRIADRSTGVDSSVISCQRIPAGEEGRRGFHVHAVDQFYYILAGTMTLELGAQGYTAGPNSLVVIPRGIPHRASNLGTEDLVHLEILSPAPEPGHPNLMRVTLDVP